jgi:beta-mannosidase
VTILILSEPLASELKAFHVVEQWECSRHAPGSVEHPDQLLDERIEWLSVSAPATAAAALANAGKWDFEQPCEIDAFDWCFRTRFTGKSAAETSPCFLRFDGLATAAEVWLNGHKILSANNMFRSYRIDVSEQLETENELVCIFRSLKHDLTRRRPRPRWKTNLVNHQQLRWHRTSLLGRIPGWAPCAPAVGPWRQVRLETSPIQIEQLELRTSLEGGDGVVHVRGQLLSREPIDAVWLRIAGKNHCLQTFQVADRLEFDDEIRIHEPCLWWPHTHGTPALHECTILADVASEQTELGRYQIGFRAFEVDCSTGFAVKVNGTPVFCRGACWTTSELLTRTGTLESLERDLRLARDAGLNMIRIGGTMAYESDDFYRLCDELGILVWQDFMFANMDYPGDDPAFREEITAEASQQLVRLARHPSVVIYCGNSEIEQQAAMLGLPKELWSNSWFNEQLPQLCRALHPGTHYLPATPTGGALPFHASAGVTHYYGIGAYLRSPSDLRRADVKFTSECLGFANVPDAETCFEVMNGASPVMHHPRWKARVPRDTGAGWDFEDVRDHYLAELYDVDPVRLRSFDTPRYLQLSRVVSGEMMASAFSEWRSKHSRNSGALVWFYKDLWPGAGWGVIDSHGMPKAAYYALKRTWSMRQVTLTDEGLNGLDIHLTNETAEKISGTLELVLLREPNTVVVQREIPISVAPRSQESFCADEILERFYDVTYAYRFGPPQHDVIMVTWFNDQRQVLSEAFHFIQCQIKRDARNSDIAAQSTVLKGDTVEVALTADRFLHHVFLKADGYLPDDNYFHLMPGRKKSVQFKPLSENPVVFSAILEAINLASPVPVNPQ